MSCERLEAMFNRADKIDYEEGLMAYFRYHDVMKNLANKYDNTIERVTATFVSLSPNNDYNSNLRSTVGVLKGICEGRKEEDITVSTYNHCRKRAFDYATGKKDFLTKTTGPKVRNFYFNVITPNDNRFVTVDGHISAIWQGKALTMREALIRKSEYNIISNEIKRLAFKEFLFPHQYQAVLWFTRKRVMNVLYKPQMDLLAAKGDVWATARNVDDIRPYN